MDTRSIRYPQSRGKLITEEYDWEEWFGDTIERSRFLGKRSLKFRKYVADRKEDSSKEIKSFFRSKLTAADERRIDNQQEKKRLDSRAGEVAALGRQVLFLKGLRGLQREFEINLLKDSSLDLPIDHESDLDSCTTSEEESSDDEDWDTSSWTKTEVEASVESLVNDIRISARKKRRRVAARMLTRLLMKHKTAIEHLDLMMTSLADKSLAITFGKRRNPEAIRVGHLISAVAPFMAEKISQSGCAKKATRLLRCKSQLASRLIQARWRFHHFEKKISKTLPIESRLRRRSLNLIVYSDVLKQWRGMRDNKVNVLGLLETIAQVELLLTLFQPKYNTSYKRDRITSVENGVLWPLLEYSVHESHELRKVSCQVLLALAETSCLHLEMVRCGVHRSMCKLLQSGFLNDRLQALEILDLLALSISHQSKEATRSAFSESTDLYVKLSEANKLNHELIDPKYANVPQYILDQSGKFRLQEAATHFVARSIDGGVVRWLSHLLNSEEKQLVVGTAMCLLKIASSPYSLCILAHQERPTTAEVKAADGCRKIEKYKNFEIDRIIEDCRISKVNRLINLLIENVKDLHTPCLSLCATQILCQLASTETGKNILCSFDTHVLVLHNLCMQRQSDEKASLTILVRGLLVLSHLAFNYEMPAFLPGERYKPDDSRNAVAEKVYGVDLNYSDFVERHSFRPTVVDLDLHAQDEEIMSCFQKVLLFQVSRSSIKEVVSFLETLVFKFNALKQIIRFFEMIVTNSKDLEYEHISTASIFLGRLCNVRTIAQSLYENNVIELLIELLEKSVQGLLSDIELKPVTHGSDKCPTPPEIKKEFSKVWFVNIESCCRALCFLSRSQIVSSVSPRLVIAQKLQGNKRELVNNLLDIIDFTSNAADSKIDNIDLALCVDTAVGIVELFGSLIPWGGLEKEFLTDLSETDDEAKRKGVSKKKKRVNSDEEHGIRKVGIAILSSLPSPSETWKTIIEWLIQTTSKKLLRCLQDTKSYEIKSGICYAFSRYACTQQMALALFEYGIVGSMMKLVPKLEKGDRGLYRLRRIPITFFTCLNSVARCNQARLCILEAGLISIALDYFLLPSVPENSSYFLGESEEYSHGMKVKGEVALFLARMINIQNTKFGTTNEHILNRKGSVETLLLMCNPTEAKAIQFRARFAALLLLAQLADDKLLSVPRIVKLQGIPIFVDIITEAMQSAKSGPLLRQIVRILNSIVTYPSKVLTYPDLHSANVGQALQRLGACKFLKEFDKDSTYFGISVRELSRSILSELSISHGQFGQGNFPTLGRPLTAGVVDEATLTKDDAITFIQDPFRRQVQKQPLYDTFAKALRNSPVRTVSRKGSRRKRPGTTKERPNSVFRTAKGTSPKSKDSKQGVDQHGKKRIDSEQIDQILLLTRPKDPPPKPIDTSESLIRQTEALLKQTGLPSLEQGTGNIQKPDLRRQRQNYVEFLDPVFAPFPAREKIQ